MQFYSSLSQQYSFDPVQLIVRSLFSGKCCKNVNFQFALNYPFKHNKERITLDVSHIQQQHTLLRTPSSAGRPDTSDLLHQTSCRRLNVTRGPHQRLRSVTEQLHLFPLRHGGSAKFGVRWQVSVHRGPVSKRLTHDRGPGFLEGPL